MQQGLVVLPGIHVFREGMVHCHVTHPVGMRVQDLLGGLITAELAQLVKELARKDHGMTATTTV